MFNKAVCARAVLWAGGWPASVNSSSIDIFNTTKTRPKYTILQVDWKETDIYNFSSHTITINILACVKVQLYM